MAAELAREIIEQSRPCDRASRVVIKIKTNINPNNVLKITSPIIDGELMIQLDFSDGMGEASAPMRYNARRHREAAVACIRGYLDSPGYRASTSMRTLSEEGVESPEWFQWRLHLTDQEKKEGMTVYTKIDQMLTALIFAV